MNRKFYLCSFFAILALCYFAHPASAQEASTAPLKALIIDGQDLGGHDWAKTTPVIQEILHSDGMKVEIATTPPTGAPAAEWEKFHPKFADFDVVVMNYYGEDWPDLTYAALDSYIRTGGGLVGIHAGTSPFPARTSFGDFCGVAWRDKSAGKAIYFNDRGERGETPTGEGLDSGHGRSRDFEITRIRSNSITQLSPPKWMHEGDELYHSLRGPAANMTVLVTAKSEITGKNEPIAWTVDAEKGRCFMTALGHSPDSRKQPEFVKLLTMGVRWAAGATPAEMGQESRKLALRFPSAEAIAKHLDPDAQAMEGFSVVRLPITNGVKPHNPCSITSSPDGTIYAANYSGEIFTLIDTDGDGLEDTARPFTNLAELPLPPQQVFKDAKGEAIKPFPYRYPCGLGVRDGWLYVATTQAILRYKDDDGDGKADRHEIFATGWPYTDHFFDWTFGIRWDAEGNLFTILCTDYLNPGKAEDPDGLRGSILKISPDGKRIERFAYGLRFAYDLAFNDQGDLFFTDNKGGDNPTEEFSHAVRDGNYGHHPKAMPGQDNSPRTPLVSLTSGYAPCGLEQAPPGVSFGGLEGDMFISAWGPDGVWNKGNILRIELEKQPDGTYLAAEHLFAEHLPKVVDLSFNRNNGSLYIAKFGEEGPSHTPIAKEEEGGFYRIIPPWKTVPSRNTSSLVNPLTLDLGGDPAKGKEFFNQRACTTCHTVDGSNDMLGPDLKSAGWALGLDGLVAAVENPSENIKTDYDTRSLVMKNGTEHIGIVRNVVGDETTLMTPGNSRTILKNVDIADTRFLNYSLMPKGLATGMSTDDFTDLLAYLRSCDLPDQTLCINCGGGTASIPGETGKWLADKAYSKGSFGYVGGQAYENGDLDISPVLLSCRHDEQTFEYRFDATPGDYEVTMLFCENYYVGQAGKRVFSVDANGAEIIANLDVAAVTAELPTKPGVHKEVHKVSATDGTITLNFRSIGKGNPIVSGIKIRPLAEEK